MHFAPDAQISAVIRVIWILEEYRGIVNPQYGMQEVSGSIPLGSTISRPHHPISFFAAVTGEKWRSQAPERR